jgi:hypothetical protein
MTGPLPKLQLETLVDSPAFFRIGAFGNVVVCGWRGPLNAESFAEWAQMARSLMERVGPVRVSFLHLMTERVNLPDAATRSEIAKFLPELAQVVALSAVLLDGSGFWSSALRGFLTGLSVVAPRNFEIRAESSAESLLQWFPAEHQKRTGVFIAREQVEYLLHEAKSWQKQ